MTLETVLNFFDTPLELDELADGEDKVDELYNLCDDPMPAPVKLVDDQWNFTNMNAVQDLFVENSGFLVVGAIGFQGCGKSTILNLMANHLGNKLSPMDGPFPVQSMKHILTNSPRTGGIDMYITQDRLILLDAQPLMSFALGNYHIQLTNSNGRASHLSQTDRSSASTLTGPGRWSVDVWSEMASVQLITFLLNVCHVIIVVSDSPSTAPTKLHRLIDRAASLKPTVFTPSVLPDEPHVRNPLHTQTTQRPSVDIPETNDRIATLIKDVGDQEGTESPDSFGANHLFPNMSTKRNRRPQETESDDVVDALNKLAELTDYSASFVHVYNQAPVSVFVDPVVKNHLDAYRYKLLPRLYPSYRRSVCLTNLGSCLVRAHRSLLSLPANNRQSIDMTGGKPDDQVQASVESNRLRGLSKSTGESIANSKSVEDDPQCLNFPKLINLPTSTEEGEEQIKDGSGEGNEETDNEQIAKSVDLPAGVQDDPQVDTGSQKAEEPQPTDNQIHTNTRASRQDSDEKDVQLDLASECRSILCSIEEDLVRILKDPSEMSADDREAHLPVVQDVDDEAGHQVWNGETLNIELAKMKRQVETIRRNFFNIQRRLSKPRLFLIPEVDGDGQTATGSPTYLSAAKFLQRAILSTPRQHMVPDCTEQKWIVYAQEMWDAVRSSPILSDYHQVLTT